MQHEEDHHMYYMAKAMCVQCNVRMIGFKSLANKLLDHFGKITEPKKVLCDQAWYKDYKYNWGNGNERTTHFIVNDLLGERRPITEAQYNDENYTINST